MITANELKTRGVSAIKEHLKNDDNVCISVRNKVKYVVITVEEYDRLRGSELDLAIIEIENDIKKGNYTTSLDKHFEELEEIKKVAEDGGSYSK